MSYLLKDFTGGTFFPSGTCAFLASRNQKIIVVLRKNGVRLQANGRKRSRVGRKSLIDGQKTTLVGRKSNLDGRKPTLVGRIQFTKYKGISLQTYFHQKKKQSDLILCFSRTLSYIFHSTIVMTGGFSRKAIRFAISPATSFPSGDSNAWPISCKLSNSSSAIK